MNITILLNTFAFYLNEYYHEELDQNLKPRDSSECTSCRNMKYDFIIVGAGAAGCVLANRLSENPNWNVLLIEAGGDEDYITDIPALGGHFTGTKYDWNYTTVKQESVCQDNDGYCKFPSGHVMGGSSTIGNLLYIRGNAEDYDEWAELGNPGWSYKDVLPYFLKSEKVEISGLKKSPYHSTKGLLPVGSSHFNNSFLQNFFKAGKNFGLHFDDYNGEHGIGMAYDQLNIEGATRSSSSKAYLNPIRDRKNLHVFKNTLVTKVLFSDDSKKKATGVACNTDGNEYKVYTSKEVILSAGAINTPKLLMLSGIGPEKHLEEIGIPVVADLPVGEGLVDLPGFMMHFTTNAKELIYDENSLKKAVLEYAKNRKGVFSAPQRSVMAAVNFNFEGEDNDSLRNVLHASGYELPDLSFNGNSNFPSLASHSCLLKPSSSGWVKLRSNNYRDPPLIEPKYFSANTDLKKIKEVIRLAFAYYHHEEWAIYKPELIVPTQCNYDGAYTDEFITCYLKHIAYVGLYPMSTARMGPISDKSAVVDPSLKVHGIDNLRVVDASVIPKVMGALPYATVDMIGEKASDIIKRIY